MKTCTYLLVLMILLLPEMTYSRSASPDPVTPTCVPEFTWSSTGNCAGQTVSFTDYSYIANPTGGCLITQFTWNFGDGTPPLVVTYPNNPSVTHTFAIPGLFNVTLSIVASCGCTNSVTHNVTINPSPICEFTWPATGNCMGQSVCFTDLSSTSTGYIVQWTWDFGDGSPLLVIVFPSSPNPCHVYAGAALTHNVSLTILTSTGCTNTTTKPVTLTPSPVCNFMWPSSGTCVGTCIPFTDLSQPNGGGPIVTWSWDFGDGGTSSLQNPCHVFATAGTYNVTLTITNSNGCTATITKTVTVSPLPVANFSWSSTGLCPGQVIQFTDLSQSNGGPPIVSWSWNFGDPASGVNNTSTIQNPAHAYSGPGSYTVTLTVTNAAGCQATITKIVTISPLPVANFAWSSTGLCTGQPVQFTDQAQVNGGPAITAWFWDFGDPASASNTSTSQNPAHSFSAPGTYSVTETATNASGCTGSVTKIVAIGAAPVPTIAGPDIVCAGTTGSVYTTETGMTAYIWTVSSGGIITAGGGSSDHTVTVTWTLPGTQAVSVTYTNGGGCGAVAPVSKSVNVNPGQTAVITPGGPTSFCIGGSVLLTASAANSYLWSTGAVSQSIIAAAAGNYVVTCTSVAGCSAVSAPVTVTTYPFPETPAIPSGPDSVDLNYTTSTLFSTGSAPSATSYEWQLDPSGAGTINGNGTSATVNWNLSYLGTVIVRVRSQNACGNSAWSEKELVVLNTSTGLEDPQGKEQIKVYPNPAKDMLYIVASCVADLTLFDAHGVMVRSATMRQNGSLDLRGLPPGLYLLRISRTGMQDQQRRIIVQ